MVSYAAEGFGVPCFRMLMSHGTGYGIAARVSCGLLAGGFVLPYAKNVGSASSWLVGLVGLDDAHAIMKSEDMVRIWSRVGG